MLKAYLRVIHALLTLIDMRRYHAQLSMVISNIDMISVVFIRDKLLKLHASMSIHTTGVSSPLTEILTVFSHCFTEFLVNKTTLNFDSHLIPDQFTFFPFSFL